jgi:uncharacterized protein YjiK
MFPNKVRFAEFKNSSSLFWAIIFIMLCLYIACRLDEDRVQNTLLVPTNSYILTVVEPSGLSLSDEADVLYTVSDSTNKVYRISKTGATLSSLAYEGSDLEGIAYNKSDQTIWVVEEKNRRLVHLDKSGSKIAELAVPVDINDDNNGPEGIGINPLNGFLMILNEKNPSQMIELSDTGAFIRRVDLNFASDYSGIYVSVSGSELWIVSDESEKLFKCDMDGTVLSEYDIDIADAEGIAIDEDNGILYIVSDSNNTLYVFDLPQ